MRKLQYIHLTSNKFTGPLPNSIGSLTNLIALNMNGNKITRIPSMIGSCTKLSILNLQYNEITSSIPNSIGNLGKLTQLYLNNNGISGSIPSNIGNLVLLLNLVLNNNDLESSIPFSLGNLAAAQTIDLSNNDLGGTIPSTMALLTNIVTLKLQSNKLEGDIPSAFTLLAKLSTLHVDSNSLTGYPIALCSLTSLTSFHFATTSHQCVSPTASPSVSPTLASREDHLAICDFLESTNIATRKAALSWNGWSCSGSGPSRIPIGLCTQVWMGVMCSGDDVVSLQLANSQITGSIPSSISGLTALETLDLSENSFTNTVPSPIGSLTNLQTLRLSANSLTGAIPTSVSALSKLHTLCLDNNKLNQQFSGAIGALVKLTILELHNNHFTSSISADISVLTNLQILYLQANSLSQTIPASLGTLELLRVVDFSDNLLTGAVPSELGKLDSLVQLILNNNKLTGAIPASVTNMFELEDLHVANNLLTSYPDEICDMPMMLRFYWSSLVNECDLTTAPSVSPTPTSVDISWQEAICDFINATNIPSLVAEGVFIGWRCANVDEVMVASRLCLLEFWSHVTCTEDGRLSMINIFDVNLTGTLSSSIGYLTDLEELRLVSDQLTGRLPVSISKLQNLKSLIVHANLGGPLPTSLGELTSLSILDIGGNKVTGSVPSTIEALSNLEILDLRGNLLTGDLPNSMLYLIKLQYLYTHGTDITGYPSEMCIALRSLVHFYFQDETNECFTSDAPSTSPTSPPLTPEEAICDFVRHINIDALRDQGIEGWECMYEGAAWPINLCTDPWTGVQCDNRNVVSIDLSNSNIHGEISESIGYLAHLVSFDISNNKFVGTLPQSIGSLTKLTSLHIRNNALTGTIPDSLGSVLMLNSLHLSNNTMTGVVPASFASLTNLVSLRLENNKLQRNFPSDLCTFELLEDFFLSSSEFHECAFPTIAPTVGISIPQSIYDGICSLLHSTSISDLRDELQWPGWVCNERGIGYVAVDLCLSEWFGVTCEHNKVVQISLNDFRLSGYLPVSLGLLTDLRTLSMWRNAFSSSLPSEIGGLTNLQVLNFVSSSLTGTIPESLGSLTNLKQLRLTDNAIFGTVPDSLTNLSKLQKLHLSGMNLDPSFVYEICALPELIEFYLTSSDTSECSETLLPTSLPTMPVEVPYQSQSAMCDLIQVSNMATLREENAWNGWLCVPDRNNILKANDLCSWHGITCENNDVVEIMLSNKSIRGFLPNALGNLANLQILRMDNNDINGTIPETVTVLTRLHLLRLNSNELTGSIPSGLGDMSLLQRVYLHYNHLTGTIPANITKLTALHTLMLYGNQLDSPNTGKICALPAMTSYYYADDILNECEVTSVPSSTPTVMPSRSPSSFPTRTPTSVPTSVPSSVPTSLPSCTPTGVPTSVPSSVPTSLPSCTPTSVPTPVPSSVPTFLPSHSFNISPNSAPTSVPVSSPSASPSSWPSRYPSALPSFILTKTPTFLPFASELPTDSPTHFPNLSPSNIPSGNPSISPSSVPTSFPTRTPTNHPSFMPSHVPTLLPSLSPTFLPSQTPTLCPTRHPTLHPTFSQAPQLFPATKSPTFKPSRFPTPIPEVPPSIFVIESTVNRTSIALRVMMTGEGSVYCGLFPTGNVPKSVSDVISQNRYAIAKDNVAMLTMTGVRPASSYDIYCNAMSPGGYTSSYFSMIDVKHTATTLCCKILTVALFSANVVESTTVFDMVTVTLSDAPVAPTTILISLMGSNGVSSPFFPSSLTFTPTNWAARKLTMLGMPAGMYFLAVDGVPEAEYGVDHSRGKNVSVIAANAEPVAPSLLRAQFASNGLSIDISYSTATDRMRGEKIFQCTLLFSFVGAEQSSCIWKDNSVISVVLSNKVELVIGSSLTVLGGKVRAKCSLVNSAACLSWQTVPLTVLGVEAPSVAVSPNVVIFGPTTVGPCDTPVLDLMSSTGSGGRKWKSIGVSVQSEQAESAAELQAFFRTAYVLNPPTAIPENVLRVNYYYDITFLLCNFLNQCGQSTHRITVADTTAPIVSILGNKFRSQLSKTILSLSSNSYIPTCNDESDSSKLNYQWTVLENGVAISVINSARDPSKLRFSAYTLTPLRSYIVELTVRNTDSQLSASASVGVDVGQGQLFAVISGGMSQSLRYGEMLTLHGTYSYDEDGIKSIATHFGFAWSCHQREPVFNSSCSLRIVSSNDLNSVISISTTPHSVIDSVHVVTLSFSDGSRQAQSSTTITITSPSAPIVNILTAFTTKPNPANQMQLSARVQSTYSTTAFWTISDSSISLPQVALSNTAVSIVSGIQSVNLVLRSHALSGPLSDFTFTLRCDAGSASIAVTLNTPPTSGQFALSPVNGTEMSTLFAFTANDWTDDDLPVTFEFGYVRFTDDVRMTMRTRAELSYTSLKLPAGDAQNAMKLSGYMRVFDGYDAENLSLDTVNVAKVSMTASEITQKASEEISNMGDSVDEAKTAISLVTSLLNRRDCSSAPNCTLLNRHVCAAEDNMCGKCLSGFIGADGPDNSVCKRPGHDTSLTCNTDADCSSIDVCSASECVRRPKNCDCSGHGTCSYRLLDTGSNVDTCLIGNSKCFASCTCDDGYSGSKCSVTSEELLEKQIIRQQLLSGLSDMADKDEATADTLVGWVSGLTAVTQNTEELSDEGVLAAIAVANKIVYTASSLGISYDKLLGLLDSVNSATIASFATTPVRRRLAASTATALSVLDDFGSLTASGMILGQQSVDSIYDLFSLSSQVVESGDNVTLSLARSEGEDEVERSYCMMTPDTQDDVKAVVMSTTAKMYSDSLIVNPFRIKLLNGVGITEAYLVLQNIVSDAYPELKSNVTYNTTCMDKEWASYEYLCPAPDGQNTTITHICNGTAAVLSTSCPILRKMPQCRIISGSDSFECDVTEYSSTNITCRCRAIERRRRQLSLGISDTGLLEVAAISVYVADTFVTTISTADDFDSLDDVRRVIIVIVMYGVMWACGMSAIALFSWRSRKAKQRKKFFTLPKHTSHESIRQRLNKYIDTVLPEVFNDDSGMARLYREIKRHHRYIQVFTATGSESEKARVITGVHLLTVQTMLMFILAVLYDTEFPADDGSCASKTKKESCLDDASIFDQSETTCRWRVTDTGEEECIYADRNLTWNMVVIISIVVAIFTSPANSVIDFMFIDILSAPTADVHKVAAVSVTDKIQRRVSQAVRRVSAVGDALMVAIHNRANKKKRQSSIFTTTRVLPEYAIEAYSQARASSREVLTGALEFQQQYDLSRRSKRAKSIVPTSDGCASGNEVLLSIEETMEALRADIVAQRNSMKRTEQMLFDLKWGLDSRGYFLRGRTVSGACSLCFSNDSDVGVRIRRELETVRKEAEEKIEKLQLATDVQIGMELLHVFILDLLGRDTVAAKVFLAKSEEDFKHKLVVSRMQKRFLWLFVIALNLFFVYFSILRGLERGAEWQRNFATACVIQFIVEMLLFETSECVIMNFVIPSVVTTDIRNAFLSVKEIIHNVCSGAYANYRSPLDAPLYLFVSTQVASQFPHLMESVIVRSYHSYMPTCDWSQQWKKQLGMSSFSWRYLARNLTLSAIVTNAIRYFAVLPGELQRLIVHMFQPIVLSGFLVAWLLIETNPIYAVVPILLLSYLTYVIWRDIRRHQAENAAKLAPAPKTLEISEVTRDESKSGIESHKMNHYDSMSDEESPRVSGGERLIYDFSSESECSEAEFGSISSVDSSFDEGVWSPSSVDRDVECDSASSSDIRLPTKTQQ